MDASRRDLASRLLVTSQDDSGSAAELVRLLYDDLRAVAGRLMARERRDHTLQPTALVNELWLKLIDETRVQEGDRARFMGLAARAMRQILVNHALGRGAGKRGGGWARRDLESDVAELPRQSEELLALDEGIRLLHELKPRVASVVEMRFFGGMGVAEVASVLAVSERTVADDWNFARAWLGRELRRDSD